MTGATPMGKKDQAIAHAYIEIKPGFDEADAAIDALAERIQVTIAKAVAEGIRNGMDQSFIAYRFQPDDLGLYTDKT